MTADADDRGQTLLVLASASPRRRELLGSLGLPFVVRPADVDETPHPDETPWDLVGRLSFEKADAVRKSSAEPDLVVIGADTVVALDGRILGKPADALEARSMLRSLSGSRHEVLTGVTVAHRWSHDRRRRPGLELFPPPPFPPGDPDPPRRSQGHSRRVERTVVEFRELTDAQIDAYVATGEPYDKAGGYGIQDQHDEFVASIDGPFDNVVGLPVAAVRAMLDHAGIDLR